MAEIRLLEDAELGLPSGSKDTELANARRLVAQHGQDLRYCRPWRRWLVWDGRRWARDETGEVERRAKTTIRGIYQEAFDASDPGERKALAKWAAHSESRGQIANMIALAESEPGIPVTPPALDADPWLLNVITGTVDLRTGELRPHAREDLLTKLVEVVFDPGAPCPTWLALLERILPSERLRLFFQRAIGYSMTGDTSEQVLFLCHGTGANGKTTVLETTQRVAGDYGRRTDFQTFLAREREAVRNDLAGLQGTRFVSAVEVESGGRLAEVVVKELTGGDTISCRFLYSEFFEYAPQFKIWLAANHKPVVRGTDYAIWRRIRMIPFTVTIPTEDQDRRLPEKLRAELPGILAWAVRGCLEWQAFGLQEPEEVLAATEAYREEMDALGGFLGECCVLKPTAWATAGELFQAYTDWCERVRDKPLTQQAFGMRLSERGLQRRKGSGGVRLWHGIGLKSGGVADSGGPMGEITSKHAREESSPKTQHKSATAPLHCPQCDLSDYDPLGDERRRCLGCGIVWREETAG